MADTQSSTRRWTADEFEAHAVKVARFAADVEWVSPTSSTEAAELAAMLRQAAEAERRLARVREHLLAVRRLTEPQSGAVFLPMLSEFGRGRVAAAHEALAELDRLAGEEPTR